MQAVRVVVATPAKRDIATLLRKSRTGFGDAATVRYQALLEQSLVDLSQDPLRPGTKSRDDLPAGTRTYHLSSSRDRSPVEAVKSPRHFICYRISDDAVEVLRVLHDTRDLRRHL